MKQPPTQVPKGSRTPAQLVGPTEASGPTSRRRGVRRQPIFEHPVTLALALELCPWTLPLPLPLPLPLTLTLTLTFASLPPPLPLPYIAAPEVHVICHMLYIYI